MCAFVYARISLIMKFFSVSVSFYFLSFIEVLFNYICLGLVSRLVKVIGATRQQITVMIKHFQI